MRRCRYTEPKQRVQPREAAEVLRARSPKQRFGDRVPNCPARGNQNRHEKSCLIVRLDNESGGGKPPPYTDRREHTIVPIFIVR